MDPFPVQILVTLVTFISGGVYAADELQFKIHRSMQGLELSCSINTFQASSFAHLNNLLISKRSSGSTQVLASVSSYQGHEDPMSYVPDAEVSGDLFSGEEPQGSLRIFWADPESILSGEYVCDVHGMDDDFLPKTISKILPVEIQSLCPCFGANPEVIKMGITKMLEINCFYPNPTPNNYSQLASLKILKIEDGIKQIVAEINTMSGNSLHQAIFGAYINASLDTNMTFLTVAWDFPTADMAADYSCEGSGVGDSGDSISFIRQVSVKAVEPTREELVKRLLEFNKVERELKMCQESLDKATQAGSSVNVFITAAETTRATPTTTPSTTAMATTSTTTTPTTTTTTATTTTPTTTKTLASSSTSTDKGIKANSDLISKCEDLQLSKGQHVVTLQPNDNQGPIQVLCDVVAPGDIWTVFQKRFNGSVDFYRNLGDYKQGFGSPHGEFWLGLANTRRLLLQNKNKNLIRFDLKELSSPTKHTVTYKNFYLGPADGFRLNIDDSINDGGYGLSLNVGRTFSTYDHGWRTLAGRGQREAGWWFPRSGGRVNINGRWGVSGAVNTMRWSEFSRGANNPMEQTTIKFQRMN